VDVLEQRIREQIAQAKLPETERRKIIPLKEVHS
jgi:hypothetical protein